MVSTRPKAELQTKPKVGLSGAGFRLIAGNSGGVRPATLPAMLDRQACERRVYRLAVLLTGNPNAATRVIEQVVDAQPDLRQLDSAHMDRLTVLRSREIRPARLVNDLVPDAIAAGLESLLPQQREAWVFSRVYQAPEREIARAMDCSVTATHRHLELADGRMAALRGPGGEDAAKVLLGYSMSLDIPGFYRTEQRRRRLSKTTIKAILIIGAVAALATVLYWWTRPLEGK